MSSDPRSFLAIGSRLETAVPATALLAHLWWYAAAVLYPARVLKTIGLYPSNQIGRFPRLVAMKGEGQFYCHQHPEPVFSDRDGTQDRSIEYFDMISTIYAPSIQVFTRPIFDEALRVMKPILPSNARILDTSCGPGTETLLLAGVVPDGEVVGMDLSGGMIRTAAERARRRGVHNVAFFQADVANMPEYLGNGFDAAFCFGAFHHYPDPRGAVRQMYRVLNERGIAFVVDPGPSWFKALSGPIARWGDPGWVSFYTGEELEQLFAEAGFRQFFWDELLPGFGFSMAAKYL